MKLNSPKIWWFVSLLVFLSLPAAALVDEKLGLWGLALYTAGVCIALLFGLRFEKSIFQWIDKRYTLWTGLVVVGLVTIFAVVYPLETSGRFGLGSDRDEALNLAVHALAEGRYPYDDVTYLGGMISPMPGAILLAAPFVALGNSAYQNIFWLLIFLYTTSLYLKSNTSALILSLAAFALSPAVQYEWISGGDLVANDVYVLVFLFFTVEIFSRPESSLWAKLAISVLLGIGLASRANFYLLLPLLFAVLIRSANLKQATFCLATVCLASALVILPLYLYDPGSFGPFLAGNKLRKYNAILPFADIGIIAATGILSITLAGVLLRRPTTNLPPLFFWMCAVTQFFPILCGLTLNTIASGSLDFYILRDRHGLFFLFFGLWGCWPYLSNDSLIPHWQLF